MTASALASARNGARPGSRTVLIAGGGLAGLTLALA